MVKEFNKYDSRRAYHWDQIKKHPRKRNPFVLARYNNVITLAQQELGDLTGKRILDVGCGDGVLTYLLAQKNAKAFGIDPSDLAISFAQQAAEQNTATYQVGSATEIPYEDGTFDAVVCSDVIEHIEDVQKALQEMKRVVKPGGTVILSTPIRITEIPLDENHIVEWFPTEYESVINAVLPGSRFRHSHPVALMELINWEFLGKRPFRLLINIFSLLKNPFEGFSNNFRYQALQYSISRVPRS